MSINEEKYNWLLRDKYIVVDGKKRIGYEFTLTCKGKPNLKAKCTAWFSDATYKSTLKLVK